MKITIEYELPEEEDEFTMAQHGHKYRSVLWDLDQYVLRKYEKYGIPADIKTPEDMVEHIREKLYNSMDMYGINLDEVE